MTLYGKDGLVYAGGTDLLVLLRAKKCSARAVLDIKGIPQLQGIRDDGDFLCVGAACNFRQLAADSLARLWVPSLTDAALKVGSVQIGYKATLAGNIQNASPAGDGLVAAAGLDGKVELASVKGVRAVNLLNFMKGPRQTGLNQGEIITRVLIPKHRWSRQRFFKIGRRNSLAISVVNGVLALDIDVGGTVQNARVMLGAVGPTPLRCHETEEMMTGKPLASLDFKGIAASIQKGVSPITDVRASAEYRAYLAGAVIRAELEKAAEELT
jgi:xanthine dehydrogenase FAD-binding subunit